MMKKKILVLTALSLTLVAFQTSDADARVRRSSSASSKVYNTGLGGALRTANFMGVESALSAWLKVAPREVIQLYFGIGGTSPFTFGFNGQYKYTVYRYRTSGFHVGGGLSLGTVSSGGDNPFFFNVQGLIGVHFRIPGLENVLLNLDGGPNFARVSGTDTTEGTSNFRVNVLAVSVHYLF